MTIFLNIPQKMRITAWASRSKSKLWPSTNRGIMISYLPIGPSVIWGKKLRNSASLKKLRSGLYLHIHHIADRTQGIVRNAQGQQNLHRLIGALAAKQPGNAIGALSQEIYIF